MTLDRLAAAFRRALERVERASEAEMKARREIRREQFTIAACTARIARQIRRQKRCTFTQLFDTARTREEVITMFLALLELARQNRLHIDQRSHLEEIYITGEPET